jgi:hypothetical protein
VVGHSDNGSNWPASTVVTSNTDAFSPANPAVGSNGVVYQAFDDPCAGPTPNGYGYCINNPGELLLAKSLDGGAHFTTPTVAAPTSIGSSATLPNYGTSSACGNAVGPDASLEVDHSRGAHDGNLYLVWTDKLGVNHVHIYFSRSTNGGGTWSTPVQIDSGNPNDGFEPAIAVDQV